MTNMLGGTKLIRGCGFRIPGIYSITDLDEEGSPIDLFGICPPWEVDPSTIGLAPRGIQIKEGTAYGRVGLWDMWDIVGTGPYPWVPDFWTEGKNFGFSRRMNDKADFEKLTHGSLHFLLHAKASIINFLPFYENRLGIKSCPMGHESHDNNEGTQMCLGLLWEAIGLMADPNWTKDDRNIYTRHFPVGKDTGPMFSYDCAKAPMTEDPEWQYAVFMQLPITRFEVVDDPMNKSATEEALDILGQSGTDLPFTVVDE